MSLVIIGGGIAGLSTALYFRRRSGEPVVLLEREHAPFGHSSAKNAGIFRPLEVQNSLVELARVARAGYLELDPLLLDPIGLCLVARHRTGLEPLLATARAQGVAHELLLGGALVERAPWLAGSSAEAGLFLPDGGTLDLDRLARVLREAVERAGVELRCGAEVTTIELEHGAVSGVRLRTGEWIRAERIVNAAGAWAAGVGVSEDSPSAPPLVSHRRHLVELVPDFPVQRAHPVCWSVETEVYVRPLGKGVLACPGDDTLHPATVPHVDEAQVGRLRALLREHAPALAGARIERSWACLRTRCSDGSMAVGPDPRIGGLYWLGGLGGHGMTVGLAVGELLVALMHGDPHPLAHEFLPGRFGSG